MAANIAKLKAAIAYIASHQSVGKVKLFKLLYLADFTAYPRLGRSITGEIYVHFRMGPIPNTLWNDFEDITADCVDISESWVGMPNPEVTMTAKPNVDLSSLGTDDRSILDEILAKYSDLNGTRLRDITHLDIPYRATSPDEVIPYSLSLYRNHRKPTLETLDRITPKTSSGLADDDEV
jgi:uncharacterized phage-associated protein